MKTIIITDKEMAKCGAYSLGKTKVVTELPLTAEELLFLSQKVNI